jgi:hydroxymethylglutaryl-CoA lyase
MDTFGNFLIEAVAICSIVTILIISFNVDHVKRCMASSHGRKQLGHAKSELAPNRWLPTTMADGYEVSHRGSSVRICLNRPAKGNAFSLSMVQKITLLFKTLSTDQSVHRIVLTGRGKYFCTGMDLAEDIAMSAGQRHAALSSLFREIDTCPKTTIAVINGPAFGGGVGLAFVCDIRIALCTSYFCLSEVRLGLCPVTISKYLVREWGVGLARMAMVMGRKIQPQVLSNAGALHAVALSVASLEPMVEEFLDELGCVAPQASAWCKLLARCASDGHNVDEIGREIFEAMVSRHSESSYGVAQFRNGVKSIRWDSEGERLKVHM